ncbi:porin family protein [Pareuzebyella sediminis]|uniref:porin family protein n=1 Tax=Pareuzebyella sediminis TaxID=2607998 RepID=UPI0011EDD14D|nr:porin family protein [Pareuzebyella sediminis]
MARIIIIFVLLSMRLSAQVYPDSVLQDTKYLEDQFYLGVTYNILLNKPENVSQRNLSYGLQAGFLKDIPLNATRTTAFALGLGYGLYSYYSTLDITETPDGLEYDILENTNDFKRNKVETHMAEIPIQFRWRNSTATEYKFWRIYAGLKMGYLVGGRSKFVGNDDKDSFYNTDIQKFQYGLTFDFGYNTFNLHAYYALNNMFSDNVLLNGQAIEMKPLRIGLIFYIL